MIAGFLIPLGTTNAQKPQLKAIFLLDYTGSQVSPLNAQPLLGVRNITLPPGVADPIDEIYWTWDSIVGKLDGGFPPGSEGLAAIAPGTDYVIGGIDMELWSVGCYVVEFFIWLPWQESVMQFAQFRPGAGMFVVYDC
jgi:hypothetical protein